MIAVEDWIDAKIACPIPRQSYLVLSNSVGPVAYVAFFEGPRPEGGLWWIMTNAEFPFTAITHFAHINLPEKVKGQRK